MLAGPAKPAKPTQPAGTAQSPSPARAAVRWPWAEAVPAAVTLVVMLWGISAASFNRDEAATLSAVHRTLPELFRLLGHLDAVHGLYYVIVWIMVKLFGPAEAVVRMPSALAMAAAAAGITLLGRRLLSRPAGIAAGLVFAALPIVSYYGQYGRSPALVTALATWASYLFARVLGADSGTAARRRWLAGYGASLVLLGLANVFALLLIPAHAVTLALRWRAADRRLALGWLITAMAAVILVGPLLIVALPQRSQISWLSSSQNGKLITLEQFGGPAKVTFCLLAIALVGLGYSVWRNRARPVAGAGWLARLPELPALAVPWLVLPAALLLAASQLIYPVFVLRYVLFCVPAAALLAGAALTALGRVAGPVALALLVLLAIPAQVSYRGQAGHGDNLRAIDRILSREYRPGDWVFYTDYINGNLPVPYSFGLAKVPDISADQPAAKVGNLVGIALPPAQVRDHISRVHRLWVIEMNTDSPVPILNGLHFRLAATWKRTDIWLRLYIRNG